MDEVLMVALERPVTGLPSPPVPPKAVESTGTSTAKEKLPH